MSDSCNSNGNSSSAHRLLLLVLFLSAYEAYALPPVEQGVLLGMKQSWKDPKGNLATWIKGKDCSTWRGVTCDSNGTVIKLLLSENQLSGAIPSSIGNLKSLQTLWLFDNKLNGTIPSSIGNLYNLKYLYLDNNQLSGAIPSSIGNLKSLQALLPSLVSSIRCILLNRRGHMDCLEYNRTRKGNGACLPNHQIH